MKQMKLDKKTKKRLYAGDWETLIGGIETLLDAYNENKFEQGYKSLLADLPIHAERIAQILFDEASHNKEDLGFLNIEETERIIIEYFKKEL